MSSFVLLDGAVELRSITSIEYSDLDDLGKLSNFSGMTFLMTGRKKGRQAATKYMPLSTMPHVNTIASFSNVSVLRRYSGS
jgi:hypothetical protein